MIKKRFILLILMSMLLLPAFAEETSDTGEVVLDELDTLEFQSETEKPQIRPAARMNFQNVEEPKWEEFCESGYETARLREKKNIFNIINFVDAEQEKSNYWAQRRDNFEKAIEHCKTLTDDEKGYCFEGVRNAELERNEMYEQQRRQINYKNRGIVIDKPNY